MTLRVTPARASASLPQFPTIQIGRSRDAFNRRPGTNAALEPKAGGPVMKHFGAESLDFLRRLARMKTHVLEQRELRLGLSAGVGHELDIASEQLAETGRDRRQ